VSDRRKDRTTVPIGGAMGNPLFEKAVAAIGLDDKTTRWMLASVLKAIGTAPAALTADDLGHVLPEVDRRLRQLLPDEQADSALKRLYRVLFEQADSA
jgi:hypothetical protein